MTQEHLHHLSLILGGHFVRGRLCPVGDYVSSARVAAMWFKLLIIFQLQLLLQLAKLFLSYNYSYSYQYFPVTVTVTVTSIAELSTLPII